MLSDRILDTIECLNLSWVLSFDDFDVFNFHSVCVDSFRTLMMLIMMDLGQAVVALQCHVIPLIFDSLGGDTVRNDKIRTDRICC